LRETIFDQTLLTSRSNSRLLESFLIEFGGLTTKNQIRERNIDRMMW